MRKFTFLGLVLSLFLGCKPTLEHGMDFHKIDSLIQAEHAADRFSGSLVIGNEKQILFQKHLGMANRAWRNRIDEHTKFDIASINKSFISALILLAVEENKLRLDDRLVGWLSKYEFQGRFNSDITIHQVLSHTAGLPDYGDVSPSYSSNNFRKFKRLHFSNQKYVDFISKIEPVASPGKTFHYSNFGYHLLCIILEDIYSLPFSKILKKKLCVKLEMNNTFSSVDNREVLLNLAEGYSYAENEQKWLRNNFIDFTLGRRIFSTAQDLYQWGKFMNTNQILSDSSLHLMKTNHLNEISKDFSYGYGWVVFERKDDYQMGNLDIERPYIIHGGSTEGYKSMLININDGEYIIAMLANSGTRTNEMAVTKRIVQLLTQYENEKN